MSKIYKTVDGVVYNTDVDLCVAYHFVLEEGFDPFGIFQLWRTPNGNYYVLLEANRDVLDCEKEVIFFRPIEAVDAFYWLNKSMHLVFGLEQPEGCSDELYEQILTELSEASGVFDVESLRHCSDEAFDDDCLEDEDEDDCLPG